MFVSSKWHDEPCAGWFLVMLETRQKRGRHARDKSRTCSIVPFSPPRQILLYKTALSAVVKQSIVLEMSQTKLRPTPRFRQEKEPSQMAAMQSCRAARRR